MDSFSCFICSETYLLKKNVKILTSDCGHRACEKCLDRIAVEESQNTSNAPKASRVSEDKYVVCPFCKKEGKRSSWTDRLPEEARYLREQEARDRVCEVLNASRKAFENTPLYDEYLEKREEFIMELSDPNEENRKLVKRRLLALEDSSLQEIISNRKMKDAQDKEWVKQIVEKEGTFYELVKLSFGPGMKIREESKQKLTHTLVKENPELFKDTSNDILKNQFQPKPLDTSISDTTLPKRPVSDRSKCMHAGGHTKSPVFKRGALEMVIGLKINCQ
eukprot:GHVP01053555.1.p1 GENE.GHVP01053555.1~~GHVP01053555.1.p1  ORF type:complete len:286 (+),score=49.67 GHVP01053555.1:28-858(+)